MISKEEILQKNLNWMLTEPSPARTGILTAMGEYAKQEAIGFYQWIDELLIKGGRIQIISIRAEPKFFFNTIPNEKAGNQLWKECTTDQLFQEYINKANE